MRGEFWWYILFYGVQFCLLTSCIHDKNTITGEWYVFNNEDVCNVFIKYGTNNKEIIEIYKDSLEWKGGLFLHDLSKFQGQFVRYKIVGDSIHIENDFGISDNYKIDIIDEKHFNLQGNYSSYSFYKKGDLEYNPMKIFEGCYFKKTVSYEEFNSKKKFVEFYLSKQREVFFHANISSELNGYYRGRLSQGYYDYLLNQFGKVDFNNILKTEKVSFSHLDSTYIEIQFNNETLAFCAEDFMNPTNDFRDAILALENSFKETSLEQIDSTDYVKHLE